MALSQERTFATGQRGGSGGSALRASATCQGRRQRGHQRRRLHRHPDPGQRRHRHGEVRHRQRHRTGGQRLHRRQRDPDLRPGQTSKTVTVNVTGDTAVEPNETFVVNLSAPSGATLVDGQGPGTILNDDGPVLRIADVEQGRRQRGHQRRRLHRHPVPGQRRHRDGELRHRQRHRPGGQRLHRGQRHPDLRARADQQDGGGERDRATPRWSPTRPSS